MSPAGPLGHPRPSTHPRWLPPPSLPDPSHAGISEQMNEMLNPSASPLAIPPAVKGQQGGYYLAEQQVEMEEEVGVSVEGDVEMEDVDEPPHQIRSYTLLFSLFLHFPYVADPPLCTSAPTRPRSRSHVIALAPLDRSRLFDGHMTYDSHVFTSILSVSNVPPPVVQPITRSHTARSGTFYSFAICLHSCLPFVFNLTVFTFHHRTSSPKP